MIYKTQKVLLLEKQMTFRIIQGDNRDVLKTIADNSIDAIVTDPPYGIDFLGKSWDANVGALETYQECLRVLKPGGHILAFSAARTYHHLAITLEQAGFEIRDQIMWIYSSGFPKSQDIGKSIQRTNKNQEPNEWEGWGTALKPAHEPIALARKPIKGSIKDNVLKHGTGALNIDATRIEWAEGKAIQHGKIGTKATFYDSLAEAKGVERNKFNKDEEEWVGNEQGRFPSNVIGEIQEEYQKYFYCPKVSRRERHMGFDLTEIPTDPSGMLKKTETGSIGDPYVERREKRLEKGNNHPTVKPVALMEYLVTLITPTGGTVLDPFNGSGSTGMAAVGLGYDYIGCELDANYVAISEQRIKAWLAQSDPIMVSGLFEEVQE